MGSRPENLSFPHVWSRFERTTKDGTVWKLKIQDCPIELYPELMEFMVEYFMKDETLNNNIGIEREELAIEEFHRLQNEFLLRDNMVIVCLMDEEKHYDMINEKPEILGFHVMIREKKNEESIHPNCRHPKSRAINSLFKIFKIIGDRNDVYDRFNVTEYLGDAGLSVHPKLRGLGIATELLTVRGQFCVSYGYKVAVASFTSEASQRSAEKAKHKTYQEISYNDIKNETQINFNTSTKSIKLMAFLVD